MLSEKQRKVLLDVRKHGVSYESRASVTLKALERRCLIERVTEKHVVEHEHVSTFWVDDKYILTDKGVAALPADVPPTKAPVHTYWLTTVRPSQGPHEHDTLNGYIYTFLRVTDGVPYTAGGTLESCFRKKYDDAWSWGNAGLKTKTAHQAETIAKDVLGDDFKGWIQSSWQYA